MVCLSPKKESSGIKKLFSKVFTKKTTEPKAIESKPYICTCVQLNVLAARRQQARFHRNYDMEASSLIEPIELPDEFRLEKRDKTLVSGHKVPYCPVQNKRWKGYRKELSYDTISEDEDCVGSPRAGQIVCPGCLARLSLSTVTCHEFEEEY
ncbi:hypothetical protein THRCLA_01319 [Thraustotheca clavata]|uniref:Uncharacterized protein n=1 Tax=Thraustotheca clavata TaxID=74557 RepID=A0A1W0A8W9_9STRA|nr:hypothetical protein THRCLA_01319 [Thraustotheca clavata]